MIRVDRRWYDAQCTEGMLSIDGVFECYTLEPRADQSQGKPYSIPAGVYDYVVQPSPHFGYDVPVLQKVPGFTAVEIHPGDFPGDTHGCTLVGNTRKTDAILNSRMAFDALMAKIPMQGQIQYCDSQGENT